MLITKYHTLYIPLPKHFHDELFDLYKQLSQKYTNEYLSEKSWKAHVTIGVLPLQDKDTNTFVEACSKVVSNIKGFPLKFTSFTLSPDQRYVFLEPDSESKKEIMHLRKRFEEETKDKFTITIPEKYLEKWESYTEEEKELLKQTGSPYKFEPHVSIVKLDPAEANQAIQEIKTSKVLGETFIAQEVHISGQSEDLDNQFPILKKVFLKS